MIEMINQEQYQSRKVRRIRFSCSLLEHFVTGRLGDRLYVTNAPQDVSICAMEGYESQTDSIVLFVHSEKFMYIPPGIEFPFTEVIFSSVSSTVGS